MTSKTEPILVVSQGFQFSKSHQRFYSGGKQEFFEDGSVNQFYSMSGECAVCGDPLYDGEPICGPRYDKQNWETVHVNCCKEHNHASD